MRFKKEEKLVATKQKKTKQNKKVGIYHVAEILEPKTVSVFKGCFATTTHRHTH